MHRTSKHKFPHLIHGGYIHNSYFCANICRRKNVSSLSITDLLRSLAFQAIDAVKTSRMVDSCVANSRVIALKSRLVQPGVDIDS